MLGDEFDEIWKSLVGGDVSDFDDPVKEFGFVVMGHEFDHYPKKMIRDIRNWDWSKDQKKNKKGASASRSGADTTQSSAMDVDVEDDDDEDETDETLGGFIVDDEDVGEGIDEDLALSDDLDPNFDQLELNEFLFSIGVPEVFLQQYRFFLVRKH
ncbi:hypothetical protein CTI12_AA321370 [Artemisia annua]|uniref:Uncharacterized protein n=1 Tax=Artemisia annua TaxID=35608 RepID=A0A2U1MYD5_ARTAN|nr:hypothetical protein CTI12_AA321370 [Artemisia annua]